MVKLEITFYKNNLDKDRSKKQSFENIDTFMEAWGFGCFKRDIGSEYYEVCKSRLINGEILRFDDKGLKDDTQWSSESDTILSIKILN